MGDSGLIRGSSIFHQQSDFSTEKVTAQELENVVVNEHQGRRTVAKDSKKINTESSALTLIHPTPATKIALKMALDKLDSSFSPFSREFNEEFAHLKQVFSCYYSYSIFTQIFNEEITPRITRIITTFLTKKSVAMEMTRQCLLDTSANGTTDEERWKNLFQESGESDKRSSDQGFGRCS